MPRSSSKSVNQRAHAKKRALERYGIELNRHQLRDIVTMIQRGESIPLYSTSNRASVHKVKINGITAKVVYDKIRKNVVTFLPLEDSTPDIQDTVQ